MIEGLKSRAVALVVCIALILAGWFGGSALQSMGGDTLTARASGLGANTVVLQANETKVTAAQYLYWLTYTCDTFAQYYGVTDWSMPIAEDTTVGDFVREQAEYYVYQYVAVEQLAEQHGVTLTAEQQAEVDAVGDSYAAYYGSEELFRYMLAYAGLDLDTLKKISAEPMLYSNLCDMLLGEGGALEPTEENLQAYAARIQMPEEDRAELMTYYCDPNYGAVYDYVNEYMGEMNIKKAAAYDRIDVGAFYTNLTAERQALPLPEVMEDSAEE